MHNEKPLSSSVLNPMDFMVGGQSLREAILEYADALTERNNEIDILHATKVAEYAYTLDAEKRAITTLSRILEFIKNVVPGTNVHAYFRIKSFLSFERKVNNTLIEACKTRSDVKYKNLISSMNYGLNDIIGFRFIVHGLSSEDAIGNIYKIANKLVPEMTRLGFIAQEHPKLKDIDSSVDKAKNPNIDEEFESFFKDYIYYVKKNGYQSLHIIFWSTVLGRFFEIQFRTPTMHFNAEFGKPAHRDYKEKRYNPTLHGDVLPPVREAVERLRTLQNIDVSKINIQHFLIDTCDDGTIKYFDNAGLLRPLICKELVLVDNAIAVVE
jgi:ppGpp synthetase/RelA/SpoT-type nucleotidyltranferase